MKDRKGQALSVGDQVILGRITSFQVDQENGTPVAIVEVSGVTAPPAFILPGAWIEKAKTLPDHAELMGLVHKLRKEGVAIGCTIDLRA